MKPVTHQRTAGAERRALMAGVAAGFAGGAAEIAWISLYAGLGGSAAAAVARDVTATVFPALAASGLAVPLGIVIHMVLAVLLGVAIATLFRVVAPRLAGSALETAGVVAALVGVWAINFLVVLPRINPAFTETVPLLVGLISKLSFGIAAALVLRARRP